MKKLDWYIIRKYLGSFFYAILLFALIAVVIDISEKIDDFLEEDIGASQILFQYYLNFIPHIIFKLSPLFIFVALIFFTSKLAFKTEIIAMLSGGVSFARILFGPYFVSALVLFCIQYVGNHYWVPKANVNRLEFENDYVKKRDKNQERDVYFQYAKDKVAYVGQFDFLSNRGQKLRLHHFENGQLAYELNAKFIEWKGGDSLWTIKQYVIREFNGLEESVHRGIKLDTLFSFYPTDLTVKAYLSEALTTPELNAVIAKEIEKGTNRQKFFQVEKHQRTAVPFATFILTILGFSIASRKTRGGMGWHLMLGIGISALFVLFLQFSTTFAIKGTLSPLVAVWIPNFIFGILSILFYRIAPK